MEKPIVMLPVTSSNINEIGYDKDTLTLRIVFKTGGVYEYYKVPADVFKQFYYDESIGRYFRTFIKGIYQFERIR